MSPIQPPLPPTSVLLKLPAASAPPGQISNLDAENPFLLATIVAATIIIGITGIAVIVRLSTQHFISKGLVIEDYVMTMAWIFQFAAFVESMISRHKIGQHLWNITIGDTIKVLKILNTVSILYALMIGLVKIAILLQYLRIFTSNNINRPLKIACWTWITVNALYYLIDMLVQIMQCLPREKIWNVLDTESGHCLSVFDIWVATGIFNTISDIVILILPLPVIARLHMPRRKRIFVSAIFATGSLACVASAIRTYYTWIALEASDKDITYHVFYVGIWVWAEMLIGILVFCIPIFPQFIFFVGSKTRNLYDSVRAHNRSASFTSGGGASSTDFVSDEDEKTRKGSSGFFLPSDKQQANVGVVLKRQKATRQNFVDVSLASFEQRGSLLPQVHLRSDEDVRDNIRILRSVEQVVETVEEEEGMRRERYGANAV